jgi:hypothetical protein
MTIFSSIPLTMLCAQILQTETQPVVVKGKSVVDPTTSPIQRRIHAIEETGCGAKPGAPSSFQVALGSRGAQDVVCPGTGHGFPSFQVALGNLATPHTTYPGADHEFPPLFKPSEAVSLFPIRSAWDSWKGGAVTV